MLIICMMWIKKTSIQSWCFYVRGSSPRVGLIWLYSENVFNFRKSSLYPKQIEINRIYSYGIHKTHFLNFEIYDPGSEVKDHWVWPVSPQMYWILYFFLYFQRRGTKTKYIFKYIVYCSTGDRLQLWHSLPMGLMLFIWGGNWQMWPFSIQVFFSSL